MEVLHARCTYVSQTFRVPTSFTGLMPLTHAMHFTTFMVYSQFPLTCCTPYRDPLRLPAEGHHWKGSACRKGTMNIQKIAMKSCLHPVDSSYVGKWALPNTWGHWVKPNCRILVPPELPIKILKQRVCNGRCRIFYDFTLDSPQFVLGQYASTKIKSQN